MTDYTIHAYLFFFALQRDFTDSFRMESFAETT